MIHVKLGEEEFEAVKQGLKNSVYSVEEWTPEKGCLFVEHGDQQLVCDVFECSYESQGNCLIVFRPIVYEPVEIKDPLEGQNMTIHEEPQEAEIPRIDTPRRAKGQWKEVLKQLIRPWHGYYRK